MDITWYLTIIFILGCNIFHVLISHLYFFFCDCLFLSFDHFLILCNISFLVTMVLWKDLTENNKCQFFTEHEKTEFPQCLTMFRCHETQGIIWVTLSHQQRSQLFLSTSWFEQGNSFCSYILSLRFSRCFSSDCNSIAIRNSNNNSLLSTFLLSIFFLMLLFSTHTDYYYPTYFKLFFSTAHQICTP